MDTLKSIRNHGHEMVLKYMVPTARMVPYKLSTYPAAKTSCLSRHTSQKRILNPLSLPVGRFLQVNPKDRMNGDKQEFVSLRLALCSVKSGIIVGASFKIFFYDQSYGKNIEHRGKVAIFY